MTARRSPISPDLTISRARSHWGCVRTINPSPICLPVAIAGGDEGAAFGDGHRDRLLAEDVLAGFRRANRPWDVQVIGQRVVDGFDFRVGEQLFIRSVGFGNAQIRGRLAGLFPRSREAIAATSDQAPRCIAGITFTVPILAVLSIPQRTFSGIGMSLSRIGLTGGSRYNKE